MSPPSSPGKPGTPAPWKTMPIPVVAPTAKNLLTGQLLTPDSTPCPTPVNSPAHTTTGSRSGSIPMLTATATPSPIVFASTTPPPPTSSTPVNSDVFKFPLPVESSRSRLATGEMDKPMPTPLVVVNPPPPKETTDQQCAAFDSDNNSEGGCYNPHDGRSKVGGTARSKSPHSELSQEDSELLSIWNLAAASGSSGRSSGPSSIAGDSSDGCSSELMSADGTNPRYKTEVCRNYKEGSKCVYGDQCQFAHGRKELREVVRNSKYKTKACQKYWATGYCAYGPRCNFLHNDGPVMEDEQYHKRKMRNSIGSSAPYPLCQPIARSYSETGSPSFCSGSSTPTSSMMMSIPPPPLTMPPRLGHHVSLNLSGGVTPPFNVTRPPPDVFTDIGRWDNQQASQVSPLVSPQVSPPNQKAHMTASVASAPKELTLFGSESEPEPSEP